MQFAMYLNALICFVISAFTFYTSSFIYRNNKKSFVDISFASSWLLSSLMWLFYAISLVQFNLGDVHYSLLINQYIVQTVAFMHGVAMSAYISYRLLKNKKISFFVVLLFSVLTTIALYYNYQAGSVVITKITSYSFEYGLHSITWIIFAICLLSIITASIFDLLRNLFYWFKRKELFEQRYFFATLSLIIYGMIGYFEESSLYATWISALFRSTIILCSYIALISYKDKEI
jgi:hypothetical protein